MNDHSYRNVPKAAVHGHRVLLFGNNPQVTDPTFGWVDPTGLSPAYDILTDPDPRSSSVRVTARSVEDGDVAVVYRVGANATNRDPGQIVAIARITSGPWFSRDGDAFWLVALTEGVEDIPGCELDTSAFASRALDQLRGHEGIGAVDEPGSPQP